MIGRQPAGDAATGRECERKVIITTLSVRTRYFGGVTPAPVPGCAGTCLDQWPGRSRTATGEWRAAPIPHRMAAMPGGPRRPCRAYVMADGRRPAGWARLPAMAAPCGNLVWPWTFHQGAINRPDRIFSGCPAGPAAGKSWFIMRTVITSGQNGALYASRGWMAVASAGPPRRPRRRPGAGEPDWSGPARTAILVSGPQPTPSAAVNPALALAKGVFP